MAKKKIKHRNLVRSLFGLGFIILSSFLVYLCWRWFDNIVETFGLVRTTLGVLVMILISATLFGFSYRKLIQRMGG